MGRETWDRARVEAIVATFPAHGWDLDRAASAHGLSRNTLESALRRVLGRSFGDMQRAAASGAAVFASAPVVPPPPEPTVRPIMDVDESGPRLIAPPPPPVIPVGREITVALAGDLHKPHESKPAWNSFLRWTADVQPDVIVLNEMLEWLSMSQHNGGNWGSRWEDDKAIGRRLFVQVRSVNPNAEIVVLESNHDTRLERTVNQRLPQLTGAFSIPRELGLEDLGIRWIPEEQSFRVGRLKVIHGHQLQPNPDKGMLPENACKRAIQRFGEPGWTVVFFHTHRRGYWAEKHDSGLFEALNLPCLALPRQDWHRGCVLGHTNGFGIAHVGPAGQTNLYSVEIENGSFFYGGSRYSAAA